MTRNSQSVSNFLINQTGPMAGGGRGRTPFVRIFHHHPHAGNHPGFDSQPQWQSVITGHAIANGLFAVVPNRCGDEGNNSFYGSSFVVDPYGRVLVQAPRDEPAVLVADIDLAQRRDWLDLFPFFGGRRPESYGGLTAPVRPEHSRRRA